MYNKTRPGLVALYDIRPGNGAGPFLQPRSPHGAPAAACRRWARLLDRDAAAGEESTWNICVIRQQRTTYNAVQTCYITPSRSIHTTSRCSRGRQYARKRLALNPTAFTYSEYMKNGNTMAQQAAFTTKLSSIATDEVHATLKWKQNLSFNHNFRKIFFSARTVNIGLWNSLPNYVVDVQSILMYSKCTYKFWAQ